MDSGVSLPQKFAAVWRFLDERTRRIMAANEALALGYGGSSRVRRAGGLSRKAIAKGVQEIKDGAFPLGGRIRRAGAGRKKGTARAPQLLAALDRLLAPETRGDPESPLRWLCKSTRTWATPLSKPAQPVSPVQVAHLLQDQDYRRQSNRTTEAGDDQPERDAQCRHSNTQVKKSLARGTPVIAVATKKKALSGTYLHSGQQGLPAKRPGAVTGHDFPNPAVPRAYPYGSYDLRRHAGFVTVGTDHDPGAFAVASLRGGWRFEGRHLYPKAREMVITADRGGSTGSRLRLGKLALQKLAEGTGLSFSVCHFPPGTRKWNKSEQRLFSFISSNWRGEPVRDYETIVTLISKTTTAKGVKVICRLDRRKYPPGRKVSDEEMKRVNVKRNQFHGDWNYVIRPNSKH